MSNVIEIIFYVFLTAIFFGMLYLNIFLSIRYRKMSILLAQATNDKVFYKTKLSEELANQSAKKLENTEGFVRFISDSREWAFNYIEGVQKSIKGLKEYYEQNGLNLNVEQAEEMAKRIEDVLSHLPDDTKND